MRGGGRGGGEVIGKEMKEKRRDDLLSEGLGEED